ncbi:hypothetical protein C3L33_20182, partial [Rhododendron williamsianum]
MFVGFCGSTQGSTESHSIEWWSFTSSFDVDSKAESSSPPSSLPSPPSPPATLLNPTADIGNPPPSLPPTESNSSTNSVTVGKNTKCHSQLCKQGPGAVVGVVTAGAFFLALFAVLLIWVYSKKFKHVRKPDSFDSEIIKIPKEFSYKELRFATKCFSSARIIGHGAFGTVYKGILPESGDIVAVKRCSHNGQGKAEDGRLMMAVDSRLGEEFDELEMRKVILVGLACSHPDPMARPSMRGVVQMLVGEAEVPVVPKARPCLSFSTSHLLLNLQDSVSDLNAMISLSTSSSSSDRSYDGGVHIV